MFPLILAVLHGDANRGCYNPYEGLLVSGGTSHKSYRDPYYDLRVYSLIKPYWALWVHASSPSRRWLQAGRVPRRRRTILTGQLQLQPPSREDLVTLEWAALAVLVAGGMWSHRRSVPARGRQGPGRDLPPEEGIPHVGTWTPKMGCYTSPRTHRRHETTTIREEGFRVLPKVP